MKFNDLLNYIIFYIQRKDLFSNKVVCEFDKEELDKLLVIQDDKLRFLVSNITVTEDMIILTVENEEF